MNRDAEIEQLKTAVAKLQEEARQQREYGKHLLDVAHAQRMSKRVADLESPAAVYQKKTYDLMVAQRAAAISMSRFGASPRKKVRAAKESAERRRRSTRLNVAFSLINAMMVFYVAGLGAAATAMGADWASLITGVQVVVVSGVFLLIASIKHNGEDKPTTF